MLVLVTMFLPTVKADSYTTKDDIVIDTKYYDFFKAKFGEDKNYKFFAYDCTRSNYSYTATCYYGIDEDNTYYKISYVGDKLNVSTGVDENFVLNGNNYIDVKASYLSQILYGLVFFGVLYVILMIFRGTIYG